MNIRKFNNCENIEAEIDDEIKIWFYKVLKVFLAN